MKGSAIAGVAALLAQHGSAQQMMRFQCNQVRNPAPCGLTVHWITPSLLQLVVERLDPLINPGVVGTPHLHQIVGGNSFNASMTPGEFDPAAKSTCTSCTFAEDFSNYWTASLYFRAPNGTFKRVPQYVNLGLGGKGGMTVYYIPPYDGKTKVTAFAPVSGGWEKMFWARVLQD